MRVLYIFLLLFFSISCNRNQEYEIPKKLQLIIDNIGIIDYEQNDLYDTKIAFSDSIFLLVNYNVAHSSFYSSTADLNLIHSGDRVNIQGDVTIIENKYFSIEDSLQLRKISVNDFISYSNDNISRADSILLNIPKKESHIYSESSKKYKRIHLKKDKDLLVSLSYEDDGTMELIAYKGNLKYENKLGKDFFPYSPTIELNDINGDGVKEIFIFYPCNDYWDSKCYQMAVYGTPPITSP